MSASYSPIAPARRDYGDRYLVALLLILYGYAQFDRGFAYIGVPPLFIGEIILVFGLLAFSRTNSLLALLASPPSVILLIWMFWVAIRTVPYVPTYNVDALRDAVIGYYGLFAFIFAGLLIQKPQRLSFLVSCFDRFAGLYPFLFPVLYVTWRLLGEHLPVWPTSGTPILDLRAGGVTHLAAIVTFSALGFRKLNLPLVIMIFIGFVLGSSRNRGSMLAFLIPLTVAVSLVPKKQGTIVTAIVILVLIGLAFAFDLRFNLPGEVRETSIQQIIHNLMSVFGSSGVDGLDGTKRWRLEWWNTIIDYTFHGKYFWMGKGFGINLADDDNFQMNYEPGQPTLRAPHSIFLTVLARAGVPGLALWIAVCFGFLFYMAGNFIDARRRNLLAWERLFLFVACYFASILINASFDPALEGPMAGIWFWSLYGIGIGAGLIYRHETKQGAAASRLETPVSRPIAPPSGAYANSPRPQGAE